MAGSTTEEVEEAPSLPVRAYRVARRLAKVAVGALALLTALVAIPALYTTARDAVFPNDAAYEKLSGLAAGLSVDTFTEALGPPSMIEIGKDVDTYDYFERTKGVFGGAAYRVRALTVHGHKVASQYSVDSCDPQFDPTIATPLGSTVTLQKPISDAASRVRGYGPEAPYRTAIIGLTHSWQSIYAESEGGDIGAYGYRAFGYGADELCDGHGDPAARRVAALPDYSDQSKRVPAAIQAFRRSRPTSFYVETLGRDLGATELLTAVPQYMLVPRAYR